MRGWKVDFGNGLDVVRIGKTRGPQLELQGRAIGEGRRSDLRVLLTEKLPEDWTEDHENALTQFLAKHYDGSWILMVATSLHARWNQLTSGEQRRIVRREGFLELDAWWNEED